MDLLRTAQTLLRRTQILRDSIYSSGRSDTISAVADQIVNFLLPSSSSSTSATLDAFQRDYITPYILSPLQSLFEINSSPSGVSSSTSSSGMADLLSLLALLLVAFISFKVLDYVRRVVMWWIMLALKLCLLLAAVQVCWYVSQYGWEKTLNDAGWLWGILEGFLGETGAQMGGSPGTRTTTAGTRVRGRQQAPLSNTRGGRGRWT